MAVMERYILTSRINPENSPASRWDFGHSADRLGATASFLCALHCAVLPFVLAVLPAVSLTFLADHLFERVFISVASCLALGVLLLGYRQHRNRLPLSVLLCGLIPLWIGGFLLDGHNVIGLHALLVAFGGSCLAVAHIINIRVRRAAAL